MRECGPIVQVSKSIHKRATHLLGQIPKSEIKSKFHLMILCSQLPIWSSSQNGKHIESATRVILTYVNQRISPHKQEFTTHTRLRLSCIGSSCEILIFLVNKFIKEIKYFLVKVLCKLIWYSHSYVSTSMICIKSFVAITKWIVSIMLPG